MCGIFGYFNLNDSQVFYDLGKYSETRGKEASGYMRIDKNNSDILKFPLPFSDSSVKNHILKDKSQKNKKTFIGHTRLKTHGDERLEANNQPVLSKNTFVVHNGIIVNYKDLIKEFNLKTESDLDSEVIPQLINFFLENNDFSISLKSTIEHLGGEVSISGYNSDTQKYFLFTNTGSIYYLINNGKIVFFSSEEWICRKIQDNYKISGELKKLEPNTGIILNSNFDIEEIFEQQCFGVEKNPIYLDVIINNFKNKKIIEPVLNRCSNCVLPDTVPFIEFDKKGICNFCNEHETHKRGDVTDVMNKLKEEKNIVVGFSGGRDSSYGLSYLKDRLNSNFVAVSYDWGMVTDLARRNQARVVGKLGVEHVWVSADIAKKRNNIKKNFLAWLSKPHLGMVPILMAGDKEWQKQLLKAAENKGTEYIVQFQSPFEHTYFKYGFAGIKPIFSSTNETPSIIKKYKFLLQLLFFYLYNFIKNPKYLNSTIFDSIKGFFIFYLKRGKIISLFEYIEYIEKDVNNYLEKNFMWECDPSTPTTWRIGDGTAPVYNYIYWIYAGFTENDFYRSNQIREGQISRQQALEMVIIENQPRFDEIKNYCELIDVDYDFVMDSLKKIEDNSLVSEWNK